MITLLRKIRKSLIASGATRKYIYYAIGEIALVVIGILVALSINNWNQERLDRKKEQMLLMLVYVEIGDYHWLQQRGTKFQNEVTDASERLLADMKNTSNRRNQELINRDLHTIYSIRWFAGAGTSTNVYDLLINGGNFGLLSSRELQNELSDLKENFGYTYNYNMLQANFIDNQLSPFLNDRIDRVSLSTTDLRIDSSLYDSPFETSYNELFTNRKFSNLIAELIQHTTPIKQAYNRIRGIMHRIDSLVLEENPALKDEVPRRAD